MQGPGYLGLEICWKCFDRHTDKPFLQRYARGHYSKIYVSGRYFRVETLIVRTDNMGIIKLRDRVKMDPDNCGAYSQFLKKGDGEIIGIHPLGRDDLGKTVQKWPLEKVGHLTVRCDNGIVIIIGPSRLVEINGFKRPDPGSRKPEPAATKRRRVPNKSSSVSVRRTPIPKSGKKRRRPRPKPRGMMDDLWG
jgi:hypothetical protein